MFDCSDYDSTSDVYVCLPIRPIQVRGPRIQYDASQTLGSKFYLEITGALVTLP
jgi:hypothetical protein